MGWVGHVARLGRRGTRIGYWWESQEKERWEGEDVGEWIILGWILERWDVVMCTGMIWPWTGTSGGL
jgi:hypothetical protein